MSITAGITAVKASLEVARILTDKLNQPDIDVADVRTKVHEMLIHMVNAQVALGEAQVEISDLRSQLDERRELKAIAEDLEITPDGHFYVRKSERDRGMAIGYCPVCWGSEKKLVPLTKASKPGTFQCILHQRQFFWTKEHMDWLEKQAARPTIKTVGRFNNWFD